MVDTLEEEVGETNSLFINCGDNLGAKIDRTDMDVRKASLIYKLTGQIGVDVMAPGASDFRFGLDFLKDTALIASYPMVCANLVDATTEKTLFEPYVVLNRGGVRILVSAVLDESFSSGKDAMRMTSPYTALREIIESVPHDYVVVIFHTGQVTAQNIALAVGGIDQILLGDKKAVGALQTTTGSGFMAYSNEKGRDIGYLDIITDEHGKLTTIPPKYILASVAEIEADREIRKQIKRFKFRELEERYPNKQQLNDDYMGVEWCIRCHKEQHDTWLKTRHASAFDTLSEKGEAQNNACLPCHETKRNLTASDPAEDDSFFAMFNLPGVQCEACHGPGARHVNDPKDNLMMEADAETCMVCHNEKRDPDFDFATDRLPGTH